MNSKSMSIHTTGTDDVSSVRRMKSGLLAIKRIRKKWTPTVLFVPNASLGTNEDTQHTETTSHDACRRACFSAYATLCIETAMNGMRDCQGEQSDGVGTRIELGSSISAA
mmetsp:Transcript_44988/g.105108  ORF Transcript_44988/g.105108 Transcript_44988/m.105108 type:complete len:110 (-) Transcript_44988:65-394(-)